MTVNRQYSCVRRAEPRKSLSVSHWSQQSSLLLTWLLIFIMGLRSQFTLAWSSNTRSCRWLFWSSTRSSCEKFVVERPATPPAISDSNITSQPRHHHHHHHHHQSTSLSSSSSSSPPVNLVVIIITSQPRPTRLCLPSCWSSLHSSMYCSMACFALPTSRSCHSATVC